MLVDPANHALGSWLFLRCLGLVYAVAFLSIGVQVTGLIGADGVLPVKRYLTGKAERWGKRRWLVLPTIFWWRCDDFALKGACWIGVALGVLLAIGVVPIPVLVVLWLLYLSLFNVGQIFLGYQWDVLLLETGFLAIFLAPLELWSTAPPHTGPPAIVLWLFYWLIFRLMFFSGYAKLRSGEPTWRDLSAIYHHYETQPLPTPLAWYARQSPMVVHQFSVAVMFIIELLAPFFIFGPAQFRTAAAFAIIGLMVLIHLTGNFGFFNLLAVVLALLLIDDLWLRPLFESIPLPVGSAVSVSWPAPILWSVVALIALLSVPPTLRLFGIGQYPFASLEAIFSPFHLVNSYGLFTIMTTKRLEIVVEGSHDGKEWRAYEFNYKPGDLHRPPPWVAPHQPRLDWQFWFAALGDYWRNPWLTEFLYCVLSNRAPVLKLLHHNPFPTKPPVYMRAVLYDYKFTNRRERLATGHWWRRERIWLYSPVLSLRGIEATLMPPADFV